MKTKNEVKIERTGDKYNVFAVVNGKSVMHQSFFHKRFAWLYWARLAEKVNNN